MEQDCWISVFLYRVDGSVSVEGVSKAEQASRPVAGLWAGQIVCFHVRYGLVFMLMLRVMATWLLWPKFPAAALSGMVTFVLT